MPKQMNIFEDLIDELKQENLIEETVVETQKIKKESRNLDFQNLNQKFNQEKKENTAENNESVDEMFDKIILPQNEYFSPENTKIAEENDAPNEIVAEEKSSDISSGFSGLSDSEFIERNLSSDFSTEVVDSAKQAEFYKKRATDEVNSLQMVEHVLSGIERDFLKITPKLYDDLEVKKSLHNFIQISQDIDSAEHAKAEFLLMQETESWYSALSHKDKNISVGYLRRFCETTRPVLSSQALAALARFYRNAPFSELVRSKFDLVMTRFFAEEKGGDIRKITLDRDEMIENLNDLYAEWSSIPLYATEEDESNIVISAIRFEDFMSEAEAAENFEELIKNDFFNRLKVFKKATHENFFAPLVTATAIECNVRVGNRYVELLLKERDKFKTENLEEKYGLLHDQIISEVVSKTIKITNVFEGKFADPRNNIKKEAKENTQKSEIADFEKQNLNEIAEKPKIAKDRSKTQNNRLKVNKWLLAVTIIAVLFSLGLYIWVEYYNEQPKLSDDVKSVNLDNSSLKEYIQTARLKDDMFYGIVTPAWDGLSNEKKEEFLRKVVLVGGEKGFVRITLMNQQGRSVAYASPEKVEIYNP